MRLAFQPVELFAGRDQHEDGMLVRAEGRLIAVLSRLSRDHGDLEGRWYIECGFPLELGSTGTFENLEGLTLWIEARVAELPRSMPQ